MVLINKYSVYLMLFLLLLLSISANLAAAQGNIATVSPMSYSLSKAMVQGTNIEISYLPPKRLPINRIASWLRKHSSHRFDSFDAVVGISAVKPELDIYPSLRQSNIRIVDIDIAQAIMPKGEKVVQANDSEYFWLNSNNLLVMLGILNRDLSALWPEHRLTFNANYQTTAASIRQLNLQLDYLLMAKDIAFIVAANHKLIPFVASLSSDTSSKQDALELGLNYVELASGKQSAESAWYIDDFSRFSELLLIERISTQVAQLTRVLEQGYHSRNKPLY